MKSVTVVTSSFTTCFAVIFLSPGRAEAFKRSIKEGILASLNGEFDDTKLAETPSCSSMNMTPDNPDPAEAAILQLEPDYGWIEPV